MADFDLVILGGGSGGYAAALRASQLGQKVVLIEKENLAELVCIKVVFLLKPYFMQVRLQITLVMQLSLVLRQIFIQWIWAQLTHIRMAWFQSYIKD